LGYFYFNSCGDDFIELRGLSVGHYTFGITESEKFGLKAIDEIPNRIEKLSLYLGSDSHELLSEFINSGYAETVEEIVIGTTTEGGGYNQDYSKTIKILSSTPLPELKLLSLGVWERFYACEYMHSYLGDLTQILSNCSALEELFLYGQLELNKKQNFKSLSRLHLVPSDAMGNKFISQSTLTNFLLSEYRILKDLLIWMNAEDDGTIEWMRRNKKSYEEPVFYELPELFYKGAGLSKLETIEVVGEFRTGEKQRLIDSLIGKRSNVKYHLDEMHEQDRYTR